MSDKKENTNKTNKRGKVIFISPPCCINTNLVLGAIAENLNYEVKINQDDVVAKLTVDIKAFEPNFIIMKMTFDKFRSQLEFLENLKKILPYVKIIVYGEPFLTYVNNVTYENPFIDYVIISEPEYTLRDILDGVPDEEILGICYSNEYMQAIKNEARPYIENLDELPIPARHLIKNNKEVTIEVSRGCPCYCFFCIHSPLYGTKFRARSVPSVINEIKECINKYDTKHFYFKSSIFNFNKNWVINLCQSIIGNNLKIDWSCDLFPNNVDEELVRYMKKSGCSLCKIGAEHGSNDILKKLGKNITLESIKTTVSILKKFKIKVNSYFIIGLPDETEQTAEETINFALELNSNNTIFNIAVPFPGTKFFNYSMISKLFPAQTQFTNIYKTAITKTHTLSRERITKIKENADNRIRNHIIYKIKYLLKRIFNLIK